MSTNHHTAIQTGAPANAVIFNSPLSQLDTAISDVSDDVADIRDGDLSLPALNFGANSTVTISGGIITRTQVRHTVDTEGAASLDTLTSIAGGSNGDLIVIRCVSNSRVIQVDGSIGNIRNASNATIYLNSTLMQLMYIYDGIQGLWLQFIPGFNIVPQLSNAVSVYAAQINLPPKIFVGNDYRSGNNANTPFLHVAPRMSVRGSFYEQAQNATFAAAGVAAGTNSGAGALSALTGAQAASDVYTNQTITNVAGTFGGRKSTTFNQFRVQHNPYLYVKIMVRTAITNIRLWVGMCAQQVTNVDTLAASTAGCYFRFSTVAPDTSIMALCNDGTTQSAAVPTTFAMAQDTDLELEIQVDSSAGIVYFTVNRAYQVQVSSNLPAGSLNLGYTASLITTSASAKDVAIARIYGEYGS